MCVCVCVCVRPIPTKLNFQDKSAIKSNLRKMSYNLHMCCGRPISSVQ